MTVKKVRAIIYNIKDNKPYFLILHRILRWNGWEILKETIEPGENFEQALIRGIKEETGLNNFEIIRNLNKIEKWQKDGIDYEIAATFLVKADMNEKISLKQEIIEHDDYEWAEKETAITKLTYSETKELIKNLEI
jgi:8-oxo-dGTP pyrophosphatase MutT (NUDIX family)